MLVLSRQRDETIMIGDEVEVTVVDIRGDKVRLGISAPRQVTVHRKEVYDAIKRENQAAAQVRPEDLPTGRGGAGPAGLATPATPAKPKDPSDPNRPTLRLTPSPQGPQGPRGSQGGSRQNRQRRERPSPPPSEPPPVPPANEPPASDSGE